MSLPVGHKLGSYEILSRIGRDVAVKICTLQFSERFEREARGVAALNHPQIGTLHGVGANYLVMELVDGEAPAREHSVVFVMNFFEELRRRVPINGQ